jgi:hypothetical protein
LCYLALVLCFIALLLCRDAIFSIWHIAGSTHLHNVLFSRVLRVGCVASKLTTLSHSHACNLTLIMALLVC